MQLQSLKQGKDQMAAEEKAPVILYLACDQPDLRMNSGQCVQSVQRVVQDNVAMYAAVESTLLLASLQGCRVCIERTVLYTGL